VVFEIKKNKVNFSNISCKQLDTEKKYDLFQAYQRTNIQPVINNINQELIGILPVKQRIMEITALLVVDFLRTEAKLESNNPGLHMSFTGSPGTGKTTIAIRMAFILFKMGYSRKGIILTVTRDDLVGQYIGHTAPKTKEVLKKAMGGILFIDEAYYLYKPSNERDYGSEAIEILLQVMENQREDLIVILAGYKEKMDKFYESNPGLSSRVSNHVDFPDFSADELLLIGNRMLESQQYEFTSIAKELFLEYIKLRSKTSLFANARSISNALDRARMRHANRIFLNPKQSLTKYDLTTLTGEDIFKSSIFNEKNRKKALKDIIKRNLKTFIENFEKNSEMDILKIVKTFFDQNPEIDELLETFNINLY
jgi:probable Rubsico expression protein CbbX